MPPETERIKRKGKGEQNGVKREQEIETKTNRLEIMKQSRHLLETFYPYEWQRERK